MGTFEGLEYRALPLLSILSRTCPTAPVEPAFADVDAITLLLAGAETCIQSLAAVFLSQEERQRAERAMLPADRIARLGSQLLLRIALSRRFGGPPDAWRFARGAEGQLTLFGAASRRPGLSVSRTSEMVAVATTMDQAVGIDLESARRLRDADLDPRDWLSPEEIAGESGSDPAARDHDRLRRWTLKEAYGKALGTGFTVPPNEMGFDLSCDFPLIYGKRRHSTQGWRFLSFNLQSDHIASIVLHRQ